MAQICICGDLFKSHMPNHSPPPPHKFKVLFMPVTIPPGQPPEQVFGAWEWGIVWSGPVPGIRTLSDRTTDTKSRPQRVNSYKRNLFITDTALIG